jgi:4-hydroxyproline epimerase
VGNYERLRVVHSHTAGEPTRVVVEGWPPLDGSTLAERRDYLIREHDQLRRAVVLEPRGTQALVGAVLTPPTRRECSIGVVFFNNVGAIGMCGHGTMGLITTLAHLGRIDVGEHCIETPVGVVRATLHTDGSVSVRNVPSYRLATGVSAMAAGRRIVGDVAWGGNWFFLCEDHGEELLYRRVDELSTFCRRLRRALADAGATGADGAEIDHIALLGPSQQADSRNFVLCPGGAYDRSPCGTGTSARVACLIEDGKLAGGMAYRQEGIVGTLFDASGEVTPLGVVVTVRGRAHVAGEATLILDPSDPFRYGLS